MTGAVRRMQRIRAANRGRDVHKEPDFEDIRQVVSRLSRTVDGSLLFSWLEENYLFRPSPLGAEFSTLSEREGQRRLVHQILGMVDQSNEFERSDRRNSGDAGE